MSMKAIKDLYTVTTLTAPAAAKTATFTSSVLDCANAIENAIVVWPGVWTDGTFTFTVQDSPDNTTFTSVTSSYLVGTLNNISGTATAITQKVSYIGPNEYLRVVCSASGTTSGAFLSIFGLTRPRKQPAP